MSLRPSLKSASAVTLSLPVGPAQAEEAPSAIRDQRANAGHFMLATPQPSSIRGNEREPSTNTECDSPSTSC